VHRDLGGAAALARVRQRLEQRGVKLMLDFVPNHMAPDHPWIDEHPDYFVQGSEGDLARAPQNYCRAQTKTGPQVLAYGRDPYFDGWPDTLQLNYGNPALQQAMIGELERIAGQCDGVRCDMAMLVLPDVFESTWGIRAELFWPKATEAVRRKYPQFQFMAEVYWDREWTMQQQGFDYTYDKNLYDRLRDGEPASARRTRLPEQDGALPGKPRRAAGGRDVSARHSQSGRRHQLSVSGPAFLPSGTIRRTAATYFTPSVSWAG
jgi:glycosidase